MGPKAALAVGILWLLISGYGLVSSLMAADMVGAVFAGVMAPLSLIWFLLAFRRRAAEQGEQGDA